MNNRNISWALLHRRLPLIAVVGLLALVLLGVVSVSLAAPPGPGTVAPPAPRDREQPGERALQARELERPLAPLGKSTIGDLVWYDKNLDGLWDWDGADDTLGTGDDEPGFNGVLVNLYTDEDCNDVIDPTDPVSDTVTSTNPDWVSTDPFSLTTISDGWYDFNATADPAGICYIVEVDPSNFGPGGVLEDYYLTPGSETIWGPNPNFSVDLYGNVVDYNDADFGFAKSKLDITKELVDVPDEYVVVSDTITYEIVISNSGDITVTYIPLWDYYNPACLEFQDADPPATGPDTDLTLGVLHWADLMSPTLTLRPDTELAPGASFVVTVTFHATKTNFMYWKEGGWQDYAPKGMPDFDQKQDAWDNPPASGLGWYYCGPVAAANSLWWFDSKFEDPASPPPPEINDTYPLVGSYNPGVLDDHDPGNVLTFTNDLAVNYFGTSPVTGTNVVKLYNGIQAYIAAQGLTGWYTWTLVPRPAFEWVEEEVRRSEDVILLLGFWQEQPTGGPPAAERVGGHYVTVAGVDSANLKIAFSDPYRDWAETGWPGRVLPAPHLALHPSPGPISDTVHNDAKYLSHDLYVVVPTLTPGGDWGLQAYTSLNTNEACLQIENFQGQNVPDEFVGQQTVCEPGGGRVWTEVEYAIAVSPVTPTIMCDPTNNIAVVSDAEDEFGNHLGEEQTERKTRVFDPSVEVLKLAGNAPDGDVEYLRPGETVTYTYIVTNTGDTHLTPITVTDDIYGLICVEPGPLAPGASFTCFKSNVDPGGDVTNTATVTGTPTYSDGTPIPIDVVTDTDDAVVDVVDPSIAVLKLAGNAPDGTTEYIVAGETVTYTYIVTNTSDAGTYLAPITVTDDVYGLICVEPGPLAPTDWFTCEYAVALSGDVTNTATVTGTVTDELGDPLPDIGVVTDTDDAMVEVVTPTLAVRKRLNTVEPVGLGEYLSFTVLITNTGDGWIRILPFHDVYSDTYLGFVSASKTPEEPADDGRIDWYDLTGADPNGFGVDLAPNEWFTLILTFTALQDTSLLPSGEITNTAIVSGALADLDGPGPDGPTTPVPPAQDEDYVELLRRTAVALAGFSAVAQEGGVLVSWEAASELETLGYNLLRRAAGTGVQVANGDLILAQYSGMGLGAAYQYLDSDLPAGTYAFALQVVRLDGSTERQGWVQVTIE